MSNQYSDKLDIELGQGDYTLEVYNREDPNRWKSATENLWLKIRGPKGDSKRIELNSEQVCFLFTHLFKLEWMIADLCNAEHVNPYVREMGDYFRRCVKELSEELNKET